MKIKLQAYLPIVGYAVFVLSVIGLAQLIYHYFDEHRLSQSISVQDWGRAVSPPKKSQQSFEDGQDVSQLNEQKDRLLESAPISFERAVESYVQAKGEKK